MTTTTKRRPLEGIKVLDTAEERGELCGRLLADLGADVVRVEPPGGSASRRLPPLAPDGSSLHFAFRNAGERSVVVDAGRADDLVLLDGLFAWADVWIHSGSAAQDGGVLPTPSAVCGVHRHLVAVGVTDFGTTGPYRDHIATDAVMLAMSGMLFRSGTVDRPPLMLPGSIAYDTASVMACAAALAALWDRDRHGGADIDLSVMEAVTQTSDWALPLGSWVRGLGHDPSEVRDGAGTYLYHPCADGFVRLITMSVPQWRALREWIDAPEWLLDPHWENVGKRAEIADVLLELLDAHFAGFTREQACIEGQRLGVAVTPVLQPGEVLALRHLGQRNTFVPDVEVAAGVRTTAFAGFMMRDGVRLGVRGRAPQPDEHRGEIVAAVAAAPRRDVAPAADRPRRPLEGIRVVDFGVAGVGPEAARFFRDYGAEVVKVENRAFIDVIRPLGAGETSGAFVSSNRGKRSVGIDITTEEGRDLALGLVRWADVLIENAGPGVMDKLGLSPEQCRAVNPGLVYVSSQMMGRGGDWSEWTGYGPNTHPISGFAYLCDTPDHAGQIPPGSRSIFPDHLVGRLVATAALAGLFGRRATGEGSHLEIAQLDVIIGMLGDLLMAEASAPGSVTPQGNASDRGAPWGMYPCTGDEEWCAITITDDAMWSRLVDAMGRPSWSLEPGLATVEGRRDQAASLDERIASWTASQDSRALMAHLQGHRVAAGFLMYPKAMPDDPHLVARGFPIHVAQPGLGALVLEGPAFHSPSIAEPSVDLGPGLGEHTREVCRELLGLDEQRIEQLIADGVLQCPRS